MIFPRFIAISAPGFIPNEAAQWERLFKAGLKRLHVRKPGMKGDALAKLIKQLPEEFHERMVIHGNPQLFTEFRFAGYHGREDEKKKLNFYGEQTFSASTHGWKETEEVLETADYVFLSPLFDSISKEGYLANASLMEFPEHLKGKKIYALGGITADNWEDAMDFGYYGVAVLGSLWEKPDQVWEQFTLFKNRGLEFGWEE